MPGTARQAIRLREGECYIMWTTVTSDIKQITDYQFRRVTIDLGRGDIRQDTLPCQDMEDFLGGIGRSFKLLGDYEVTDAFAPASPLLMNLGIFSGTEMMTGLRTFFSAYSPLKEIGRASCRERV